MTRYDVFLTAAAEEDIAAIHDYIEASESVDRADRAAAILFEAVGSLSTLPYRGNVPRELSFPGAGEDVRELHCWSCRLFYQIVGSDVIVIAIADGRRDMQSFLQRRLLR
jgi:toxin ParE1/3/4